MERLVIEIDPRPGTHKGPYAEKFHNYLEMLDKTHIPIVIASWDDISEIKKEPPIIGYFVEKEAFVGHGQDDILTMTIGKSEHQILCVALEIITEVFLSNEEMRTDIVKEAFDGHHNGRVKNNFQSQCLSDIVVEKKALVGIIIEKEDSIAKLEKVVEKLGMFLAQKRQQKRVEGEFNGFVLDSLDFVGNWNDLKEELKYRMVGMQKSQRECRKVNQSVEKSTRMQKSQPVIQSAEKVALSASFECRSYR
ncbi:hypothetical protein LR48_Vigan02g060900 [Vigna angularis]|uniref:Uncharacterized protein n=1 Tax=Phaseolus angularis TaxID=3914 RepID=A0A0L9TWC8_PHAAN|nr:hypothetical protein LR48_Vigan02g060900 [Vigna angularis]